MNKKLILLTCLTYFPAFLIADTTLDSEWSLSGNIALTSDYVFRGYTQTDGDPAIQGGFDVGHSSGFFAGVWASNVESDSTAPINYGGANVEVDLFLGWKGNITDSGLELTAKALRFMYPGTDYSSNNSNEFSLNLGYDFTVASLRGSINYSDDYFGTGTAWYWDTAVAVPLGPVKLSLQVGRSDYEHGGDYTDYSMGVSGELVGLDLSLSYIGTDGVPGGCITRTCKERAVFTVSKEF